MTDAELNDNLWEIRKGTYTCPPVFEEALIRIRDNNSKGMLTEIRKTLGICANMRYIVGDLSDESVFMRTLSEAWLIQTFERWDLDHQYPVEMQVTQEFWEANSLYNSTKDKYDPSTRVGKLRLELLDKLIKLAGKK